MEPEADPATSALDALEAAIDALHSCPLWQLSARQRLEALARLEHLNRRAGFAFTRMLADADTSGASAAVGAPSTAAFLQGRLRLSRKEAHARIGAARELCPSTSPTGATLAPAQPIVGAAASAGTISDEHVRVVGRVLHRLPIDSSPQTRFDVESTMVRHAERFDPTALAKVGRHLLHRLVPDTDPSPEDAARRRGLRFYDDVGGMIGFSGACAPEDAATIRTALDPLSAPGPEIAGVRDRRSQAQRRIDALTELCRRALDRGDLPTRNGERPHLTLTIVDHDLRDRTGSGDLEWAGPVDPATSAWIACDAHVTPVVMNPDGVPVRIGPATRTIPAWLRKTIIARDRGCAFPQCPRPAAWCDIHHVVPWERGGPHHRDNLVLLCCHHHKLIHRERWTIRFIDGIPHIVPPPWIDPLREPQRNRLHHAGLACTNRPDETSSPERAGTTDRRPRHRVPLRT